MHRYYQGLLCGPPSGFHSTVSIVCRPPPTPPSEILQIHYCHVPRLRPVGLTQIDGSVPPASPACHMAGGPRSHDIHQCLAVRCFHRRALTLGPGPADESLLFYHGGATRTRSNDATKRGAIAWERLGNRPVWHRSYIQPCRPVPVAGVVNAFHFMGRRKFCGLMQKY